MVSRHLTSRLAGTGPASRNPKDLAMTSELVRLMFKRMTLLRQDEELAAAFIADAFDALTAAIPRHRNSALEQPMVLFCFDNDACVLTDEPSWYAELLARFIGCEIASGSQSDGEETDGD